MCCPGSQSWPGEGQTGLVLSSCLGQCEVLPSLVSYLQQEATSTSGQGRHAGRTWSSLGTTGPAQPCSPNPTSPFPVWPPLNHLPRPESPQLLLFLSPDSQEIPSQAMHYWKGSRTTAHTYLTPCAHPTLPRMGPGSDRQKWSKDQSSWPALREQQPVVGFVSPPPRSWLLT